MHKKKSLSYFGIIIFVSLFIFFICSISGFKVNAYDTIVVNSVDEVDDVTSGIEEQIVIVYKEPDENNIEDLELTKNEISEATSLSESVDVITVQEKQDGDALIEKIEENDRVCFACQNVPLTCHDLPDDPLVKDYSYYYTNSQIEETWDITNPDAEEVVVAVIDTGLNPVNQDFNGRVYDVIDVFTPDDPQKDVGGHGTMVASDIVSVVNNGIGLAGTSGLSNVKVLPYRIGGTAAEPGKFDLAHATIAIEDVVNNHQEEVKVVNMSWGAAIKASEISTQLSINTINALQTEMDRLYDAGIIAVASAGNDGKKESSDNYVYNYPACCDHVISVASITKSKNRSSSSTYNEDVDIAAVGSDVPVITKDGEYKLASGTSFSSPIVAGACAFLASTTAKSASEITNAICQTATHPDEKDIYTGYGIMQLKDAFEYLAGDIDFSVSVEERDSYYEGDTIIVTAVCDSENDMTFEFKVNNDVIDSTDGIATFKIKDAGIQSIEVTGILPCGAQDTQSVSINAEEKNYKPGDLNGDTIINLEDVQLAKRAAMKDTTLVLATKEYLAGDLNGDGKITINEARKIKRAISNPSILN